VNAVQKTEITRIDLSTNEVKKTADYVAEEKPLYVFLNRTHYVTIFCSPTNLKELAVGHLLSEGIVKSVKDIDDISLSAKESTCRIKLKENVDVEKRLKILKHYSRVIFSVCGSQIPFQHSRRLRKIRSDLTVKAKMILECTSRLNLLADTFRKTGGVHVAAIFKGDGTLVTLAEDIGRHNAVDKVIGAVAMDETEFGACFLALSGRLTGDIVMKAAQVGLPIVVSLAGAIDSGITVARDANLTLIGFVRGNRMNVYNLPERIVV